MDARVKPAHDKSELQRDPTPVLGRPVAGVVDLRGFAGQIETGAGLPSDRHAFHEILDLLQVASRPLLFEADELPARLTIDLLRDVDSGQFLLVDGIGVDEGALLPGQASRDVADVGGHPRYRDPLAA